MAAEPVYPESFRVIDSHTGGEMTRVVTAGWPTIPGSTMRERWAYASEHHAHLRKALILEPRGGDNFVGVVMTEPITEGTLCGVLFFARQTFLTMCGHATIGTVITLQHMGKIAAPTSDDQPTLVKLDTPVGVVTAELLTKNQVRIRNVPCYVHKAGIAVKVPPSLGAPDNTVIGDLAFGGNWNFLPTNFTPSVPVTFANRLALLSDAQAIRDALAASKELDGDGNPINFVQFFGTPTNASNNARMKNFVAFDGTFDRSPCGTGTSAKMAQMWFRGDLKPNEPLRMESIAGTLFIGEVSPVEASEGKGVVGAKAHPTILAKAYVVMEGNVLCYADDSLVGGIEE